MESWSNHQLGKQPHVSLFRRGQWYESLDQVSPWPFSNINVCLAPELIILDDLHTFRMNDAATTPISRQRRIATLAQALQLFIDGQVYIGGLGTQTGLEFEELLASHRGLPLGL